MKKYGCMQYAYLIQNTITAIVLDLDGGVGTIRHRSGIAEVKGQASLLGEAALTGGYGGHIVAREVSRARVRAHDKFDLIAVRGVLRVDLDKAVLERELRALLRHAVETATRRGGFGAFFEATRRRVCQLVMGTHTTQGSNERGSKCEELGHGFERGWKEGGQGTNKQWKTELRSLYVVSPASCDVFAVSIFFIGQGGNGVLLSPLFDKRSKSLTRFFRTVSRRVLYTFHYLLLLVTLKTRGWHAFIYAICIFDKSEKV